MILLWIVLGLVIWTIISIIFVMYILGDEHRQGMWYDYILGTPILIIATIIGQLTHSKRKNNG